MPANDGEGKTPEKQGTNPDFNLDKVDISWTVGTIQVKKKKTDYNAQEVDTTDPFQESFVSIRCAGIRLDYAV